MLSGPRLFARPTFFGTCAHDEMASVKCLPATPTEHESARWHELLLIQGFTYIVFFFLSTDKICDQISDAVLDAHLKQDPDAKVACGKNIFSLCIFFGSNQITRTKLWFNCLFFFHGLLFLPLAETVAKTGMILLAGEVTSHATVDYQKVVRDTIRQIGYDDSSKGVASCAFLFCLW